MTVMYRWPLWTSGRYDRFYCIYVYYLCMLLYVVLNKLHCIYLILVMLTGHFGHKLISVRNTSLIMQLLMLCIGIQASKLATILRMLLSNIRFYTTETFDSQMQSNHRIDIRPHMSVHIRSAPYVPLTYLFGFLPNLSSTRIRAPQSFLRSTTITI